jgi:predicted phage terminase large subunit-like protein
LNDLLKKLPSLPAIKAERARRSLARFIREFWPVVEPSTPLHWNWHIEAIAEHLEAVSEGYIQRLVINIPPGHMKSLIVSVFWPAWEWANKPGRRSLFSSYSNDLAVRDSIRCRSIIESDQYREWYSGPAGWTLSDDQNRKDIFKNTLGGERKSTSVGGAATGFRGDAVVVDDPHNASEITSDAIRKSTIEWWDKAMSSRLNDMRTGARVIIMQRLHEDDLTGHVLRQGGYEHLCLPSEFDPKRRSATCAGAWSDPRNEPGELLFPTMFPAEVLDRAKVDLGSDGYAGQHDQSPFPADGGMLKEKWWRFWTVRPSVTTLIQTWDMAFKGTQTSDFVVGQVWGKHNADYYLLDQIRGRFDFPQTLAAVQRLTEKWPTATLKLVEDAANGPAVISALRGKVEGLLAVKPEGGKEARAAAVSPMIEAGNVYLPDPAQFPWVNEFIAECTAFPLGKNDDQVDAMTQGLNRLRRMSTGVTQMTTSGGKPRVQM